MQRCIDVAIPMAFVPAVVTLAPLNVALAPLDGAVKATVTPEIGFDAESVTFACSALANAVPAVALCGVPETATIAGGGGDDVPDGTNTTSTQ